MERKEMIKKIVNMFHELDEWHEYDEKHEEVANEIINVIVPKGAVVLTKDEYDKLNRRIAFSVTYDEEKLKEFVNESISNVQIQIDEIRKKTAKEILSDILKVIKVEKDIRRRAYIIIYEEEIFKLKKKLKEKYDVEV